MWGLKTETVPVVIGALRLVKNRAQTQVDLLPKSEIFDGVAVYCDTEGVTFQGGLGACSSRKFCKIEVAIRRFPLF